MNVTFKSLRILLIAGISPSTIHRWKARHGGMTLCELKRLKALEEENDRLKRIVAQQALYT